MCQDIIRCIKIFREIFWKNSIKIFEIFIEKILTLMDMHGIIITGYIYLNTTFKKWRCNNVKKVTSTSQKPSTFKIYGKRLIAILVCVLTITCSILVPTNASSLTTTRYVDCADTLTDVDLNLAIQTTVPRALYALVELPADWWGWSYTPEQLRKAYLGAPINYVGLLDNGVAQAVGNKVVFPVVYNGMVQYTLLIKEEVHHETTKNEEIRAYCNHCDRVAVPCGGISSRLVFLRR